MSGRLFLAMWNSDSRQWSTASGYQSNRDWNRGKQWSSSTNANVTVPAPNPVIPANFKSDASSLIPQLWGQATISFIESFSPLIGLGKHSLQEGRWMISECISFAFVVLVSSR